MPLVPGSPITWSRSSSNHRLPVAGAEANCSSVRTTGPEAVQVRIGVYQDQTAPVLDFYRENGLLKEISGVGAIEEINARALKALQLDT